MILIGKKVKMILIGKIAGMTLMGKIVGIGWGHGWMVMKAIVMMRNARVEWKWCRWN